MKCNSGDESQQMMQANQPRRQQLTPAPPHQNRLMIWQSIICVIRFSCTARAGNLFQPYGYAPNTLVDLLQTRNMTMPDQAAPNLNLFGNPTDFT
jgi:hypothetical protein